MNHECLLSKYDPFGPQETGMKPHAVSKAVTRLAERLPKDSRLQRVKLRALRILEGSEHEP